MKCLLILHAGESGAGHAFALAQAAAEGAQAEAGGVQVCLWPALQAGVDELLAADALLFVTPEKFGYMAGALKDFFDRTFYPAQGKVAGLPYALIVVAGNDGLGAIGAVERIARGYPFKPVAEPLLVRGAPTPVELAQARELGEALASGLLLGIF
ncbi:flavodoxin family protein [Chitinimonas arctica]|uniref:Flavodoxin family protein n=1 Tax=Chitinimonas arctica TaxID=2594795 RepID=A0A516SHX5_9NEIS|nr:NAD(P)H-dependent oxidoreductase [Chitinimonas arctica]QDQ27740.1 flavodoxin family protein [Chitinimonas arctica]